MIRALCFVELLTIIYKYFAGINACLSFQ
jgi:hypothetical protein